MKTMKPIWKAVLSSEVTKAGISTRIGTSLTFFSKEFHPDRYFRKQIGPYTRRLERIFKKVLEAHEILSDPELCQVENQPEVVVAEAVDAGRDDRRRPSSSRLPRSWRRRRRRCRRPRSRPRASPSRSSIGCASGCRSRSITPRWPRAAPVPLEIFRAAEASLEAGRLQRGGGQHPHRDHVRSRPLGVQGGARCPAHPGGRRPGVEAARDAERSDERRRAPGRAAADRGRVALPATRSGAERARRAGLSPARQARRRRRIRSRPCSRARPRSRATTRCSGGSNAPGATSRPRSRPSTTRSSWIRMISKHGGRWPPCALPRTMRHRGEDDEPGDRNRSRDDQLMRGGDRERSAHGDPERGRLQDDALDVRHLPGRQAPRGTPGQAPGDHERAQHDLRQQAPDRPALRRSRSPEVDRPLSLRDRARTERRPAHQDRRQELHVPRDRGHRAARDEARRRGVPLGDGAGGGDHGSRLLQRRPAPVHQGRRQDRGPRGPAHHQRADRGGARLRHESRGRREDRRLRPRRRHLRHLDPRDVRRRDRGARDLGQHLPRRRGPRPPHRPAPRRVVPGELRASICAATRWRSSASRTPRRRPNAISRCAMRSRSICPSSPATPKGRATSTTSSRARASRASSATSSRGR